MRWEKISTAMERVPEVKDAEERDRKEIFEDAIFAKKKELDEGRRMEAINAQAKFKALLAQIEGTLWGEGDCGGDISALPCGLQNGKASNVVPQSPFIRLR
jgi:hypothetical protein